jgi:hypothetical protein
MPRGVTAAYGPTHIKMELLSCVDSNRPPRLPGAAVITLVCSQVSVGINLLFLAGNRRVFAAGEPLTFDTGQRLSFQN